MYISQRMNQLCPICKTTVPLMERYPRYICNTCIDTGTFTMTGDNRIHFQNQSVFGGFASVIDGNVGSVHECLIQGIPCHAQEARFGGIVIQTTDK